MTAATHDAANNRTLDISGNDHHFRFANGSTTTSFPTKLSKKGYYFDGGDFLETTDLIDFGMDSFSYGLMVDYDRNTNSVSHTMGRYGASAVPRYGIKFTGTVSAVFLVDSNNISVNVSSDTDGRNDKQYIIISVDRVNNMAYMFMNGRLAGSANISTLTGNFSSPSGNFQIGKISSFQITGSIYDAFTMQDKLNQMQAMDKYLRTLDEIDR